MYSDARYDDKSRAADRNLAPPKLGGKHGGKGLNSSFTVRKISYGTGVERVFCIHSPRIEGVDLVKRGSVRRAKLNYLRSRLGKKATLVKSAD